MRSFGFFLLCLALALCLHSAAAVPHQAVRRQDGPQSEQSQAPISTSFRSSRPSATIAPSSEASLRSDRASSTADASPASSAPASTIMQVPATASFTPHSTSTAEPDAENPLPIHPKVTPAMGLAGALLLISGLVYAVIGIKNKWVYVFGSAAYLAALAVTVLIIYLMNPPVSDGVQGAFFVAAFVTGVVIGVLSLVFADITEGFGCLLGGFCLSMWFLSLKAGGLIPSSTGRAIFIGCMSAGGYSLSFSRYTRTYGLIASIAFSGATATILGIDCLARAGLKEFWLYLWSLNDDLFPLNTNTYPVTKNMKAEAAGIVIITVFGVISQLRVWNMVKERRAKSAAQELEKQEEKDREEEARGRNVEDNFQKERAQWEAAYGGKSIPDSSVRTSSVASPKGSTSIREKEVYADSVEMVNLSKSGVAASGQTVTVSVLKDDDIRRIDAQGNPVPSPVASDKFERVVPEESQTTKRTSVRAAVPPPPAVVPLPFTVPTVEEPKSEDGDNDSISAVPESNHDLSAERRPMSKRISDMSATKRFSLNRTSRVFSESSEALVHDTHIEEDRASSLAATLDDDDDAASMRRLSPPHSPIGTEHDTMATLDDIKDEGKKENDVEEATLKDAAVTSSRPVARQSLTASTDPKPDELSTKRTSRRESRVRADTVVSSSRSVSDDATPPKPSASLSQSPASQAGRAESHVGSLRDGALPDKFSKVALSYRTNEWAKHLEAAEKPDLDELPVPISPSPIPEEGPEEKSVPVSDEIAAPLIASKTNSRRASAESKFNGTGGAGLIRSPSTFSQESLLDQRALTRSPQVASPVVLSRSNSGTRLDALSPLPSNTLLGQRETLMRKRTSSQSFTPNTSAANLLELADQENMSLAQRRQILQHHQAAPPALQHQTSSASQRKAPPSASQKWQQKTWATKGAPAGFDSHQPRRTTSSQSDQKREQLYAGWRDTVRDVTPPQTQAYVAEQQRAALMAERRQKEMEKQQREAAQQQRASMLDSMMRSGHMMDAHREAMRKMQANASRNAS
ncbi:hypothetical protein BKA63DRAFT_313119 [Paraphoma chrysanthemicola]|nr:hypothetical protein BKA63DRAFT_313119 [Paraphoma chrysanthemicola]